MSNNFSDCPISWRTPFDNEKSYQPVSRILFPRERAVIIYLAPVLLQGSSCLPSGAALFRRHRASRPRSPVYVAFQHARFTRAGSYPPAPWALTPRFHPHLSRGSYFLWHLLWMFAHPPALNRYIALCCPDFPPPAKAKSDDPVGSSANIEKCALHATPHS